MSTGHQVINGRNPAQIRLPQNVYVSLSKWEAQQSSSKPSAAQVITISNKAHQDNNKLIE